MPYGMQQGGSIPGQHQGPVVCGARECLATGKVSGLVRLFASPICLFTGSNRLFVSLGSLVCRLVRSQALLDVADKVIQNGGVPRFSADCRVRLVLPL